MRVNMGETKILLSGTNMGLERTSVLSTVHEREEMYSSVLTTCFRCTRKTVVSRAHFAQTLSLNASDAWGKCSQGEFIRMNRICEKTNICNVKPKATLGLS